eukprot:g3593.t1
MAGNENAVENLSEDLMEEFRQAFALFDKDGNGSISSDELGSVLQSLGQTPTQEDLDKMIKEVDNDDNSTIEFSEFCTMMASKMRKVENEEEISEAFKVFDINSDGYITINELTQTMSVLDEDFTDEECETMIKLVGTEGKVNFNQFKNMMLSR